MHDKNDTDFQISCDEIWEDLPFWNGSTCRCVCVRSVHLCVQNDGLAVKARTIGGNVAWKLCPEAATPLTTGDVCMCARARVHVHVRHACVASVVEITLENSHTLRDEAAVFDLICLFLPPNMTSCPYPSAASWLVPSKDHLIIRLFYWQRTEQRLIGHYFTLGEGKTSHHCCCHGARRPLAKRCQTSELHSDDCLSSEALEQEAFPAASAMMGKFFLFYSFLFLVKMPF